MIRPLAVALFLSACAASPAGPSDTVFADLVGFGRSTPAVRGVNCAFVVEEGSEWVCRYQERASSGAWVDLETVIARDGDRWLLIDTVCTADQALADRGRCRR